MLYSLAQLKIPFPKLLCMHPRGYHIFRGWCFYEKGNREYIWFYGDIYICERCDEEYFIWDMQLKYGKNAGISNRA
jgi:hypothetical protein